MPAPVTNATLVYALIAAAVIGCFYFSSQRGMISKDSFQIASVVTVTITISCWLMWLCTWMHQWHPLIAPIYKDE
jgi:V-type H+-transporting ATPase subunit e